MAGITCHLHVGAPVRLLGKVALADAIAGPVPFDQPGQGRDSKNMRVELIGVGLSAGDGGVRIGLGHGPGKATQACRRDRPAADGGLHSLGRQRHPLTSCLRCVA